MDPFERWFVVLDGIDQGMNSLIRDVGNLRMQISREPEDIEKTANLDEADPAKLCHVLCNLKHAHVCQHIAALQNENMSTAR